jgi:putative sigma-54 modulation protein
MDVHIRSVDVQMTDDLRDYAERRAEKLDRLIERSTEAHVELRRRPQRTGADVTAVQVTVRSGRLLLRSEETDYDARKAIDQAIDKMARQMRKFHDRRSDRQARKPELLDGAELNGLAPIDVFEDDATAEDDEPYRVVRTKRFSMKPMATDEAIEQMELLGHSFFLFRNVDDDQFNVVYVRHDGTYGLIAPDVG